MGLLHHADQGFLWSLGGGNLLKIQGGRLVFLDIMQRAENQAFHLQLVYVVQLFLNACRQTEGQGNIVSV